MHCGRAQRVRMLAGLTLAASLVSVAVACTSTPDDEQSSPELVVAGPETEDLFVHGAVVTDGEPVRGAEVSISLWPEGDHGAGETFELWSTPAVSTDSQGRWSVQLDPDSIPSAYFPAAPDFLNFDLNVHQADRSASWSTTLWLLDDPVVWRTEGSRAGDSVMEITLDLGTEQITLTDSQGNAEQSDLPVSR